MEIKSNLAENQVYTRCRSSIYIKCRSGADQAYISSADRVQIKHIYQVPIRCRSGGMPRRPHLIREACNFERLTRSEENIVRPCSLGESWPYTTPGPAASGRAGPAQHLALQPLTALAQLNTRPCSY